MLYKKISIFLYISILLSCFYNQNMYAKTYAVVIGISQYENVGIKTLNFAHKDAEAFASFLKSKNGGNVPDSNIIFLKNEDATFASIYNAMDWLLEVCKPNDLVYFYFSGHGDMENNTIFKLGFLISYNTPPNNYINNAVRIEDLNYYANTLSVKTKAKVILITDACHSGNININNFGNQVLLNKQLETIQNNEIRLASCKVDEVSVEDAKWGGGRGVFSYYLINGLNGKADKTQDGKITLKELNTYLQNTMQNDLLLKEKKHIQTPVVAGIDTTTMSFIDKNLVEQEDIQIKVQMNLPSLKKDISNHFFDVVNTSNIDDILNIPKLFNTDSAKIAFEILDNFSNSTNIEKDTDGIKQLKSELQKNPDALKRFNRKVVELISKRGQEIINLYLTGDEQELERRRYYNSVKNNYINYAKMFAIASRLVDAKSPLYHILIIKYHYFLGVAYRLNIINSKNKDSLLNMAFEEQNKAIQLEENAAYIQNEMGILYLQKKEYNEAKKHFEKATDIVPEWAIAWSNLTSTAIRQNEFEKAKLYADKVEKLQENYSPNYIYLGMIYEHENNYLLAEQNYRKCIRLNSRHFAPFEKLGNTFLTTTDYALADSFYYESALRKQGYNFTDNLDIDGDGVPDHIDMTIPTFFCNVDDSIENNDIMTLFVAGYNHFFKNDYKEAEKYFKKIILIDPKNSLVFHYIGYIKWKQKKRDEAAVYLNYAIQYYMDDNTFNEYCDSVKKYIQNKNTCINNVYRASQYDKLSDYFLLADVYENWNHFSEAEKIYKDAILINNNYKPSYYKLWRLHEKNGKYEEAEKVLLTYNVLFKDGINYLNQFYAKATETFPNSAYWQYSAGNFHYEESFAHPQLYYEKIEDENLDYDILHRSNSINISKVDNTDVKIIGTEELVDEGYFLDSPKQKAIDYFEHAKNMITDKKILADIYEKTGDLFFALQKNENASFNYDSAILYKSDNASTRIKYIHSLNANYVFDKALIQLDTLYARHQIDYNTLLLYIKYKILSSNFIHIDSTIEYTKTLQPYDIPKLNQYLALNYYLQKKFDEAEKYYEINLKNNIDKSSTLYTLSSIYYMQNNKQKAFDYLSKAIENGFNYYWVLHNDVIWSGEMNNVKWQEIVKNIQPKPFPIQ